jgi:hypothetical protein
MDPLELKEQRGREVYRDSRRGKPKKSLPSSCDRHLPIGNSCKKFCSYCRPSLSIRIFNRELVKYKASDASERHTDC